MTVTAAPAPALQGPSDSNDFEIFLRELPGNAPGSDEYFRDEFNGKIGGTGWSFGDRAAYACAFIEHYTNNIRDFEIHYEVIIGDGYQAGDLEINDRSGLENRPDGSTFCGDGEGPGASLRYNEAVMGDHFPHGDFFQAERMSDLIAYRDADGDGFVQADDEINGIDYSEGDYCDQWYWTPGRDSNGNPAAIGWWDEDGPSSPDGHQQLDCQGNGPTEPNAAILVSFQDVAPNVVVCVIDESGHVCDGGQFGEPPPSDTTPPATTVSCDLGCDGLHKDPVTVTLDATDDESGVATTFYSPDGGEFIEYTGPFQVTNDTDVRFFSVDNDSNEEPTQSLFIDFDLIAPVTSITCNGGSCDGAFSDPVTVALSATDAEAGVASTVYSIDGSDPTIPYTEPFIVFGDATISSHLRTLSGTWRRFKNRH
jgi:hypothetical protein